MLHGVEEVLDNSSVFARISLDLLDPCMDIRMDPAWDEEDLAQYRLTCFRGQKIDFEP